jgi:hypothetical protein
MATTTATIFIGEAHQNHSGVNPTHFIQFTENSRPALILRDLEGNCEPIVIIPTLENTIDDIYLMVAVFILNQVKPSIELNNPQRKCLYELLNENERIELYNKTISVINQNRIKIVFNILSGSHLFNYIDQIKKYPNDYEVTLSYIKKEFNVWTGKVDENEGAL